ncbi:SWIM zinc finger family protein [Nocardioides hungaricus]
MSSSGFFPIAKPRAVDGGLKARSKRGAIAQSWWSERFVAVLEEIGVGGRLQRGRSYARKGQVISLEIDAGSVTALVQGSRARPYRVRIGITAYGKSEWAAVEGELAGNAWYLARLLAGEMPEDIEDVFAELGLSLFPATARELSMDCSCPDWAVPCKHLASVFYLLAESFDDDPFAILAWRGRDRDDLLANLQAARTDGPPAADVAEAAGPPLAECLDRYFSLQADLPRRGPARTASDALLAQLPAVDLTVRGTGLLDVLRPLYGSLGASLGASLAPSVEDSAV